MLVRHVDDSPRYQCSRAIEMHPTKEFLVIPSPGVDHQQESGVNTDEGFPEIYLHVSFHCVQRIHDCGNERA